MDDNDIELVILHEMGHVLGIGTFWHVLCGSQCEIGKTDFHAKALKRSTKPLDLKILSNLNQPFVDIGPKATLMGLGEMN